MLIFWAFFVQNEIVDLLRILDHLQGSFGRRNAAVAVLVQDLLRHPFGGDDGRRLAAGVASARRVQGVARARLFVVELYLVVFSIPNHMAIIFDMLFLLLLFNQSLVANKSNFHVGLTADVVVWYGLSMI